MGDARFVHGHSVRLVKESTSLSDGQEGTYTGNDGKVYKTICIDGRGMACIQLG
jgi:hypothetical protein